MRNIIADYGRYRKVKLDIVLEVAFNSIQPGARHTRGLPLHFPRIKAVRRDKNVDSAVSPRATRKFIGQFGPGA
jgi:DNA ligase-1